MIVSKRIKVRPGRGNLKKLKEAIDAGDARAAAVFAMRHARNRQKAEKERRNTK